jgi:hypothetical protein
VEPGEVIQGGAQTGDIDPAVEPGMSLALKATVTDGAERVVTDEHESISGIERLSEGHEALASVSSRVDRVLFSAHDK